MIWQHPVTSSRQDGLPCRLWPDSVRLYLAQGALTKQLSAACKEQHIFGSHLTLPHLTSAAGCSSKPEVSEEDKKREAVRAQLEKIQQEYQDAQQQARSAQQQLKCV
jgi:hypothetical protein